MSKIREAVQNLPVVYAKSCLAAQAWTPSAKENAAMVHYADCFREKRGGFEPVPVRVDIRHSVTFELLGQMVFQH